MWYKSATKVGLSLGRGGGGGNMFETRSLVTLMNFFFPKANGDTEKYDNSTSYWCCIYLLSDYQWRNYIFFDVIANVGSK